ncbi:MAG: methyltransferase domain-containing protein [Bacteroidetes bacterium]|nr:methyltransferase domain-containing protein [Bacteroidota bacterium]
MNTTYDGRVFVALWFGDQPDLFHLVGLIPEGMNISTTPVCEEIVQNWFNYFNSFYTPMYREAFNMLELRKSTAVLDLSCGAELFAGMAACRGIDLVGFDHETFDGHGLPFDDNSFDAVTGFNIFQNAASLERLVNEASRVLKHAGGLAIGIWDRSGFTEFDRITRPADGPFPNSISCYSLSLSKKGRLEAILRKAGLQGVHAVRVRSIFSYKDMCDGIENYLETSPDGMVMDSVEKDDFRMSIREGFRQYHLIENTDFLRNSFLIVAAAKA